MGKNSNYGKNLGGLALLPLGVFILLYLGTGVILSIQGVELAFYQMSLPVPVAAGCIVAFIMFKGSIPEKFEKFVEGCGHPDVVTMCIIYILAGAFSTVASAMGGVDSTVNLGLTLIPVRFITAGLFIISALIATACGTSMGTISAVVPIAVGVADKGGLSIPLVLGAVVGGAMFGDNLSVISDTTIAATRTQGVEMRDKFRMNLFIALPAAIIAIILFLLLGSPIEEVTLGDLSYDIIKVVPYLFVLIAAIAGMNVFVVLVLGILIAGGIGIATTDMTLLSFCGNVYDGFVSMSELFLGSLLMGGLVKLITDAGGLQFIVDKIGKFAKSRATGELSIAAIVSLSDIAIANNTIAILASGDIAKGISKENKIDPRKTTSLLDIFACVFQGLIPWSAQLITAGSLTGLAISPINFLPYMWYQMLLFVIAIIAIFVPGLTNRLVANNPWDWEHDMSKKQYEEYLKENA
ncbi:MAG: Na+/H+ antiporter NhaC family protein [Clostridiales bacterium]|nr:Na+/H+ antiporter NhaC family protein [Clostridiales bacterium]